ncbi:MAG: glycosyltransferase [Tannerellaceae bacterium]|jgi:glycosyltransferase involved in cell wall biosynthesis|nr:glycosyltransferase [Tannerellaceae bacterium]
MKIALIHDWLTEYGGGEKVFAVICSLYPDADVFTLTYNVKSLRKLKIENKNITPSFIQSLPFGKTKYRYYLPFFTKAIESFDLTKYDLIISSSSCVAKGVLTHINQIHICYCHSPVRYAWDLYFQYLNLSVYNKFKPLMLYIKHVLHKLRLWDVISSNRVDYFICNSNYIQKRIWKVYRRVSQTIYPPISTHEFTCVSSKDDYYFVCSRLVSYKKIDLIVKAFREMSDKKLIVIGNGPEKKTLLKLKTSNIEILGFQPFHILKAYMEKAKAFVFAADEDFGMVCIEAQACGTPVIAFGKGGSLETVKENLTGVFFYQQTAEAIIESVHKFETLKFDYNIICKHAEQFSEERFKREFKDFIEGKVKKKYGTTTL